MDYKEITRLIKSNPKNTGKLLDSKEKIKQWVSKIVIDIAVYFKTTMGFPEDMFKECFEELDVLGQLEFCLEQVRKNHYIK